MFELDVTREFSAAHYLRGYQGNCSNLHGHNWIVQVFIQAEELDSIGIAVDFKVLKKELDTVLGTLDHKELNTHPEFTEKNPTSENIARYLFRYLSSKINTDSLRISKVRVCESANSGASYRE